MPGPRPWNSRPLHRWLAAGGLALGLAGAPAPSAHAGDDAPAPAPPANPVAPRLALERIVGAGAPYTGPGFHMASWRPGRDAWVEWRGAGAEAALWEVEAATGRATRLVGRAEVDAMRPPAEPEVASEGIGRGGPPDHLWAPDGSALFLRTRGDLVHVDLATGRKRRVTKTPSPMSDVRVAPDGLRVSFCRDHDLFTAEVADDGPRERRLTTGGTDAIRHGDLDWVYPEELDAGTAAWWSPDSTRLAYLTLDETHVPRFPLVDPVPTHGAVREEWYPKAGDPNPVPSVRVVAREGGPSVLLDLGAGDDVYVPWAAWAPDGKSVLVAVLDRAQRRLALRRCDPATGASTTFLVEEDPAWVDVPPPPRYLARGDAFVWKSRRGGRSRLWLVPLDGTAHRALTPTDVEATALAGLDEVAGVLHYATLSPDRRREEIWRTTLAGDAPRLVTDDAFSHGASFSPTGRWWVDTASRATVPPVTTVREADGPGSRLLADTGTPELRSLGLVPPELTTVPVEAGPDAKPADDLDAMVVRPRPFDPKRTYPVIVHVYGGPGSGMVRDAWRGTTSLFDAYLAQEGFVVLKVDGRGSAGRGTAYERRVHRNLGTLEVEDLGTAIRWLAKRPWVDATRVGVWGWSYGGYLAALALARAPTVFRAAVAVAPVTDWRLYDTIYTERYMGLPAENVEGYRISAPTTWAKDVRGALLLAHGLADDNVHFQNTARLVQALTQAGRPYDLQVYPQRAHGIEGAAEHLHLFRRIVEHFRTHLQGAETSGPR